MDEQTDRAGCLRIALSPDTPSSDIIQCSTVQNLATRLVVTGGASNERIVVQDKLRDDSVDDGR